MTRREQLVLGFVGVSIVVGSITVILLNRRAAAEPDVQVHATGSAPDSTPVETLPSPAPVIEAAAPEAAPAQPAAAPEIVVSIRGAVERAGVYTVPAAERVNDLVERAGGLAKGADTSDINLAARLIDGTTLTIPGADETEAQAGIAAQHSDGKTGPMNPAAYTLGGWNGTGESEAADRIEGARKDSAHAPKTANSGDSRLDLNRASSEELQVLPGVGPVLAKSIIDFRENTPFQSTDDLQKVHGIGPKRYEALRDLVTVTP